MEEASKFLEFHEAVMLLPETDTIHTFSNPSFGILIGTDWPREEVLQFFLDNDGKIELAGEMATRMEHGLAFTDGERRLFFATKGT